MQLNLGIIWKDGKVINHRSLLKVAFNPVLRMLGLEIASVFKDEVIKGLKLQSCPKRWYIPSWDYDATDCYVERKRILV